MNPYRFAFRVLLAGALAWSAYPIVADGVGASGTAVQADAGATSTTTAVAVTSTTATFQVPSTSGQGPVVYVPPPTRDVLDVAYGPLPSQLLDVHLPATGTGPFPVVLYLHGGGWVGGTRSVIPDVIETLEADTGVAVVSVDYRVVTKRADGGNVNTFPTASYDTDRAIRFVRANAARWSLNPDMIIAAGASAGGQLAAMAGVAPGVYHDPTLTDNELAVSPSVQGVIDYVGPSDFTTFYRSGGWAPGLTTALLGCRASQVQNCDPAKMHDASIAPHMTAAAPPAYLAYGHQDTLVPPNTQGDELASVWAHARGDATKSTVYTRGVWYEDEANAGHDFNLSNSNYKATELWVKSVVAGALNVPTLAAPGSTDGGVTSWERERQDVEAAVAASPVSHHVVPGVERDPPRPVGKLEGRLAPGTEHGAP